MPILNQTIRKNIFDSVQGFKSRRMKILEGLRATIEQITVNNGFAHDVDTASFNVNAWRDNLEGDTPKVYVIDNGTPEIKRMAGLQRQYKMSILLFGVCKGFTIEEFEEHLADVEEAIELNGNLCGVVNKMEINNIKTDNQLFSIKEDTHLYEMEVQAEYIRCHGDPR